MAVPRESGQLICGRANQWKWPNDLKTEKRPRAPASKSYFLAAVDLAAASAYFLVKRSTRPAVSTSFCLPVKKGWQFEQISTRSMSPLMVERVWKVWPQAQCTVTG